MLEVLVSLSEEDFIALGKILDAHGLPMENRFVYDPGTDSVVVVCTVATNKPIGGAPSVPTRSPKCEN